MQPATSWRGSWQAPWESFTDIHGWKLKTALHWDCRQHPTLSFCTWQDTTVCGKSHGLPSVVSSCRAPSCACCSCHVLRRSSCFSLLDLRPTFTFPRIPTLAPCFPRRFSRCYPPTLGILPTQSLGVFLFSATPSSTVNPAF